MTSYKTICAAALLSAALVAPASAEEVISNPGYCAQFYPNANCQNFGPGNPYRGPNTYQRGWRSGYAMYGHPTRRAARHHY